MSYPLTCPGCRATLRVRVELAGKTVKCPRCAQTIPVPAREELTSRKAGAVVKTAEDSPGGQGRPEAEGRPASEYKPCPRCGAVGAERVRRTAWGSFYGPALFSHV